MKNQPDFNISVAEFSEAEALDLILNTTRDAYLLADKNLCTISFNKAASNLIQLHLKKQLSAGDSILQFVPVSQQSFFSNLYNDVLNGETSTTESEFLMEDGTQVCYENKFAPALDKSGEIIAVVIRSRDITQRKQIEKKISESEERLRFALDATDQGAWDWNMQTDEVIYSGSYKKMYGFTDNDLQNHLSEWQSRIHPEDRQRIQEAVNEHISSDDPYYETTYRIQLKNGDYKWVGARGKLLSKDKNGNPLRMIGTHTDLTKTIQAEEEIRKMHERFVYAAKATSNALWEWDALSGQAYVSTTFTELFGWQADEDCRFDQWHHYIHPDDSARTVKGYYDLLNNKEAKIWQDEYRFLKADGSYAVVSDKAYIIRDTEGKPIRVIGATQDVTLQKKTEEELQKSNERFDIMLQATNELLWEWHIPSDHIFRSPEGVKKVYGMANDDAMKSIGEWMKRVHPDDHKKTEKAITDILQASHQQTFEIEYRFLKDDGNYAYVYDRGILLKDENGRPLKMIGAAQDISERKRLEMELLQNELEYKKLINQATVDSQEQERGEIGKELHDNINQVLTTTKLYLELALTHSDLAEELTKKSSYNITTVINEIRQLSRSLMDPSLGDLGMVDSINDLIENINLTQKTCINVHVDDDIESFLSKKQKLTIFRIIQESLNNVMKHAGASLVTITLAFKGEMVNLYIIDNGVGFSHDSVKKGAGLKNISNRVYLINGDFSLESSPGNGCRIQITFPINHQEK